MEDIINLLRSAANNIELIDITHKRELQTKDLEIERLTGGIKSMEEVIKTKDDIRDELKKFVEFANPANKKGKQE